jgi:hypothetical protein
LEFLGQGAFIAAQIFGKLEHREVELRVPAPFALNLGFKEMLQEDEPIPERDQAALATVQHLPQAILGGHRAPAFRPRRARGSGAMVDWPTISAASSRPAARPT